jgi:hypothetical protein
MTQFASSASPPGSSASAGAHSAELSAAVHSAWDDHNSNPEGVAERLRITNCRVLASTWARRFLSQSQECLRRAGTGPSVLLGYLCESKRLRDLVMLAHHRPPSPQHQGADRSSVTIKREARTSLPLDRDRWCDTSLQTLTSLLPSPGLTPTAPVPEERV